MMPYIVLFLIPTLIALHPQSGDTILKKNALFAMSIVFILFIGLRHQVGGDWEIFLNQFSLYKDMSFYKAITVQIGSGGSDFGYVFLNVLIERIGGNIYWVNLVCAALFVFGVWRFALLQAYPWLVIISGVSYLSVVVAMGYTRQAVAIGFIFAALSCLQDRKNYQSIFYIILAVTFHKAALIMLSFFILYLTHGRRRLAVYLAFLFLAIISVYTLHEQLYHLIKFYITSQYMDSAGAIPRSIINIILSVILLKYLNQMNLDYKLHLLYKNLSITLIFISLFVGFASTAVDRLSLFFFPVQLMLFGQLPMISSKKYIQQFIGVSIIAYSLVLMLVWLFFAHTASHWVPYHNLFSK